MITHDHFPQAGPAGLRVPAVADQEQDNQRAGTLHRGPGILYRVQQVNIHQHIIGQWSFFTYLTVLFTPITTTHHQDSRGSGPVPSSEAARLRGGGGASEGGPHTCQSPEVKVAPTVGPLRPTVGPHHWGPHITRGPPHPPVFSSKSSPRNKQPDFSIRLGMNFARFFSSIK